MSVRPAGTWWAVLWHADSQLDGCVRRLQWLSERRTDGAYSVPVFYTRRECRAYIEEHYGYVRSRPDLRAQPCAWHVPTAVLVDVSVRP